MLRSGCMMLVGLLSAWCHAGTITVSEGQSIQAAINSAQENDLIIVAPGTYNENLNLANKRLTLRSAGGPDVTVIDGGGNGSVIACDVVPPAFCDVDIEGFTIRNGSGDFGQGGGIRIRSSSPRVENCIIRDNVATFGGGAFISSSNAIFVGCKFFSNQATGSGGDARCVFSSPVFINCTFNSSTAVSGSNISTSDVTSRPGVINCIVWGAGTDTFDGPGIPIVSYSCVDESFGGIGNIQSDPMFVDEGAGNLRLQSGSPCIDAGESPAVAEQLEVDLDGNVRGVNVDAVVDLGVPVFGIVVDMGAYEVQDGVGQPDYACASDVSPAGGNGVVNVDDLFALLDAFGGCP